MTPCKPQWMETIFNKQTVKYFFMMWETDKVTMINWLYNLLNLSVYLKMKRFNIWGFIYFILEPSFFFIMSWCDCVTWLYISYSRHPLHDVSLSQLEQFSVDPAVFHAGLSCDGVLWKCATPDEKKNRICVLLEACGVHVFIKEKKEKWKLLNRQKLPIMQFKKNNFKKLYCWI